MRTTIWITLLWILMAGCTQAPVKPLPPNPDSYVVLLPNEDGTTGSIVFRHNMSNSTTIDQAGSAVELDNPESGVYQVSQDKIAKDFSEASSARPDLPVSFMLYFKSGGSTLTTESKALIPQVLREVESRPVPDVSIIGHTDTVGKDKANEALALNRAKAIAKLIQQAGLKVRDLTVTSHGERNLLVKTPDEIPEEKNRRVEITVR